MSRYIKSFENDAAIQSAIDNGVLSKPYVAYDESANTIDWNSKVVDYTAMPLTFKILSDGNIYWKADKNVIVKTIEYSKNNGEWISITSATGSSAPTISVTIGDIIKFRGSNETYGTSDHYVCFDGTTAGFKVFGNVMSLISKTDYSNITSFTSGSYNLRNLFYNCTGLTDASNLVLPATGLTQGCYNQMFYGCTSLITAPELTATTLANNCYASMFRRCTSLTTAPELPATTLTNYCYANMFESCSNLNYIKCLATTWTNNSLQLWVQNVQTTSGTLIKDAGTTWTTGSSGIPANWTVIDA